MTLFKDLRNSFISKASVMFLTLLLNVEIVMHSMNATGLHRTCFEMESFVIKKKCIKVYNILMQMHLFTFLKVNLFPFCAYWELHSSSAAAKSEIKCGWSKRGNCSVRRGLSNTKSWQFLCLCCVRASVLQRKVTISLFLFFHYTFV